ncbi:hypothetical protein GHK92_11375 [Nocardioides sp. dk4132]|uniref:transglutaminase family protein n=1 Tax=unclassified Nocardioides TaxID=2615069 RepID=UPI001294FDCB|nr:MULTISPECIES: DUF3488 and transglutaminase-like domain-containing protein [unclassified Nocardioides]MQW76477.1 hypothetical protein [Nocardioides sp. dk4132]QGA07258.1 hypothetical protein GFH29_07565 [Nocardioides sp. dk884]
MSRRRPPPGASLRLAAVAAGTAWVSMLSWSGLAVDAGAYLGPLLLIAVAVVAAGALLRRLRAPAVLVAAVQLLVAGAAVSLEVTGSPVPLGPAWAELTAAFDAAGDSARLYAAPVPVVAPPIDPFMLAAGAGCLVLVDLLACTLRRVALAGLPLLAVQSVPTSLLATGPRWWVFLLSAAGFLLLLFLDQDDRVARWGRPFDAATGTRPEQGTPAHPGPLRASAGAVGTLSVGIALALPLVIPSADLDLLGSGRGGAGGSEIELENPMVDLTRDLVRGEDFPLLRVRTTDRDPSYLRIAVLNRFSADEWSSGDREVPVDQLPRGELPDLEGVAPDVERIEHDYEVEATEEFESTWLPTQAPVSAVVAPGDWRYDVATMDFIAGEDDLTTAGLSYEMTAVDLVRVPEDMVAAPSGAGLVDEEFLDLPVGLSPVVDELATSVTAGAGSPYEKAVALQDWFRSDGNFTYSTDVEPGNGSDDLQKFLVEDRRGYCEQFAAAMAVMARSLDIPARVAVGFLRPDRVDAQTWEYSTWDLHAWPELFVPGSGWVAFEPTPPDRAADVPPYTRIEVGAGEEPMLPSENAQPNGDDLPRGPESVPAPAPAEEEAPVAAAAEETFPWGTVASGILAVVLLTGSLLLPGGVRRGRRERRLRGGPEEVWAELRDTARDLGIPWPDGRSPRQLRRVLLEHLGSPAGPGPEERPAHGAQVAPEATAALDRLVLALERGRYARPGNPVPQVRADAETCLAALEGGAPRRARRRAAWWPRTAFTRRTPTPRRLGDGEPERTRSDLVDRVG